MNHDVKDETGDDLILPFTVEGADVRGRIARFGPLVDHVLRRHAYPDAVSQLLGEALTLTALLGSSVKFSGIFSLQTKSDGPVSMLVADYVSPGHAGTGRLRGYAAFNRDADFSAAGNDFSRLMGKGYFALTIDQRAIDQRATDPHVGAERYQGIVPLDSNSLAECAQNYFRASEQIPTSIHLAAAKLYARSGDRMAPHAADGVWRAGGMLIQHLPPFGSRSEPIQHAPEDGPEETDAWRRCRLLMATLRDDELTDPVIPAPRVLYRLFHEQGVRVYQSQPAEFGCRCTRERLESVLAQYPRETLETLLEDGLIFANCEFCNEAYRFTLNELSGENHAAS